MRGKESKIALFFMMDQEVMDAEQTEENMTKLQYMKIPLCICKDLWWCDGRKFEGTVNL